MPSEEQEPAKVIAQVLEKLDNLKSYEMTVVYSERLRGMQTFVLSGESDSKSEIKYKAPDLLVINATNKTLQGTGPAKIVRNITMYTSFDGTCQKQRATISVQGKTTTQSYMLDTSINKPDKPFQGCSFQGYGLANGDDYIETIKNTIPYYDFAFTSQDGDIIELAGTFNKEKYHAKLLETMSPETAKGMMFITSGQMGDIDLRVDTKTNMVVGYTQTTSSVERKCQFEGIKINPELNSDLFTFKALPEEEFIDLTEQIKQARVHEDAIFNSKKEKQP